MLISVYRPVQTCLFLSVNLKRLVTFLMGGAIAMARLTLGPWQKVDQNWTTSDSIKSESSLSSPPNFVNAPEEIATAVLIDIEAEISQDIPGLSSGLCDLPDGPPVQALKPEPAPVLAKSPALQPAPGLARPPAPSVQELGPQHAPGLAGPSFPLIQVPESSPELAGPFDP